MTFVLVQNVIEMSFAKPLNACVRLCAIIDLNDNMVVDEYINIDLGQTNAE